MNRTLQTVLVIISIAIGGGQALAQQGGGSPSTNMSKEGQGHDSMGMDMQTMAKQCAAVRQRVKREPASAQAPDVKKMIAQCDEMDRMMGRH